MSEEYEDDDYPYVDEAGEPLSAKAMMKKFVIDKQIEEGIPEDEEERECLRMNMEEVGYTEAEIAEIFKKAGY